jgi:hypothetical protein
MTNELTMASMLTVAFGVAAAPARTPAPAAAPAAPSLAGEMPAPAVEALVLPAALGDRIGRAETSGIAWAAALDRYLVVVDDAVYRKADGGRTPALLALARDGRFDADPVLIQGIAEVDDAESICAAGPDRFYLLTSHAPDSKGRVRWPRRQLLELKLEGRVLRAARGAVDLTDGKGSALRLLDESGVARGGGLDLEGVATHDGALYIGMKAPLGPAGEALTLRIEDPADAIRRDHVRKGRLTLWARLALAVKPIGGKGEPAAPATVQQGIADLTFGRDGVLYLVANSPKGALADGGGALWRWARPAAGIAPVQPELVARFPGMKPEGIALTPDGAALAVIFDRDGAPPQWTIVPLKAKSP